MNGANSARALQLTQDQSIVTWQFPAFWLVTLWVRLTRTHVTAIHDNFVGCHGDGARWLIHSGTWLGYSILVCSSVTGTETPEGRSFTVYCLGQSCSKYNGDNYKIRIVLSSYSSIWVCTWALSAEYIICGLENCKSPRIGYCYPKVGHKISGDWWTVLQLYITRIFSVKQKSIYNDLMLF